MMGTWRWGNGDGDMAMGMMSFGGDALLPTRLDLRNSASSVCPACKRTCVCARLFVGMDGCMCVRVWVGGWICVCTKLPSDIKMGSMRHLCCIVFGEIAVL